MATTHNHPIAFSKPQLQVHTCNHGSGREDQQARTDAGQFPTREHPE